MAIIQSYPINYNVNDDDLLLGVTNIAPSGNPIYQTKSFRVSDVRGSGGGGGSITIGIANGLSLQGSVLSLGLASSSANGALSSDNWTTFNNKQNALTGSGIVKSTNGTISYIPDNSTNWNTAYNDKINSAAVTGTTNKTLTLTQQDGGTITASWVDDGGSITLTTNGTSGPSTLINNVLNIPQYTGGGGAFWGGITGTIGNQTDLQIALNAKVSLTGSETIAGVKIFSNIIRSDERLWLKKNSGINFAGSTGYSIIGGLSNGSVEGFILANANTQIASLNLANLTTGRTYALPDKAGTFAMTSDIPTGAFASSPAPANATATGALGEIRYDANFIYVCVATNTWRRSALTAW
jgi:hypothetical protein